MDVGTSWWAALAVVVTVLLALDLLVDGRRDRPPTAREAAVRVAGYCAAAGAFAVALLVGLGARPAGEFVAGWVTEYSLSVDNLFVFLVLMARFAVPPALQLRVLTIGILLALVLRAVLIAVGAAVVARYAWVFVLFGAFLLWTAWGILREGGGHGPAAGPDGRPGHDAAGDEPGAAPGRAARLLERRVPTTRVWYGARLVVTEGGRRVLTPMVTVMVAIGTTDLLFALDSIPAVFGLTREPFLVVAANAFALMGLRPLFFLVGGLLDRLPLLSHGLAAVLAFIGVKLVLEGIPGHVVPHVPVAVSLGVVVGILGLTTAVGLVAGRRRGAGVTDVS